MPSDANIFSAYLRPPKSVMDYRAEYDVAEGRRNALQLAAMDLSERTQANQRAQQVRNALMGLGGAATDEDRVRTLRGTATPEGFTQADALEKALLERKKVGAEAGKNEAETAGKKLEQSIKAHDFHVQQLGAVNDPQAAQAWAIAGLQSGVFTPEQFQRGYTNIPADAAGFAQWKQSAMQGGVTATEQLKMQQNKLIADNNNATSTANNAATNATTLRGQDITAKTAREGRAQTERHFQAGLDSPQYMQTDAGLVALPKKVAPGQTIAPTVITGPGGETLGKPLKDIPAAVNTAIITNTQSMNQIDRALTLLDGKNIGDPKAGGRQGDKAATGVKGYLPQAILNRVDPSGVDARAEVADIGSLKIHDRSGAAVTISESPRLMPFIPQSTDDAATVTKKLRRLRTEIANEGAALQQTYSKEQGYRPSPVKPAGTASGVPADIADILNKHGGKGK